MFPSVSSKSGLTSVTPITGHSEFADVSKDDGSSRLAERVPLGARRLISKGLVRVDVEEIWRLGPQTIATLMTLLVCTWPVDSVVLIFKV